MQALARGKSSSLWDRYWADLKIEWFKLEVLQDYSAEDAGKSLNAWLNGDKQGSLRLMKQKINSQWVDDCQKLRSRRVKLLRLHVLEELQTDYIAWELEHYRQINIPLCGEQVYLLEKSQL